jgi:hypothetical protein
MEAEIDVSSVVVLAAPVVCTVVEERLLVGADVVTFALKASERPAEAVIDVSSVKVLVA